MPKCKSCGADVKSGVVMHVECYEAWEADLSERAETIRERERELDMREFELDVRDGYLEMWYEEIISTEKQAKRLLAASIACAALSVMIALVVLFL